MAQNRTECYVMLDAVCAMCGKVVMEPDVREGEKLFHLDCYLVYKRQKSTRRPENPATGRMGAFGI